MQRRSVFDASDDDHPEHRSGDFRHSNPIALMILAEFVDKRDREDDEVEHQFRLVRS